MRIGTHSSRKATSVSQMALPRLAGEPGKASLSRLRAMTKRARSRMSLVDQQARSWATHASIATKAARKLTSEATMWPMRCVKRASSRATKVRPVALHRVSTRRG